MQQPCISCENQVLYNNRIWCKNPISDATQIYEFFNLLEQLTAFLLLTTKAGIEMFENLLLYSLQKFATKFERTNKGDYISILGDQTNFSVLEN